YGFPVDIVRDVVRDSDLNLDMAGYEQAMADQREKSRSRVSFSNLSDAYKNFTANMEKLPEFVGYDRTACESRILLMVKDGDARDVAEPGQNIDLITEKTPFYAESGGQVGDRGVLRVGDEEIEVVDTQKENNLTVHITSKVPTQWPEKITAIVDRTKRRLTANNHSATHLLHSALREVLGGHVEQKGSLVNEERLRFDFSHFSKMGKEEILAVEKLVNEKIRANIQISEHRDIPIDEARNMGAVALFGEKYGERVRVIAFDPSFSTELCGGTHVQATGQIGLCKIVSEGAIAAGIRRIEAYTGAAAEEFVNARMEELDSLKALLKNPRDSVRALEQLLREQDALNKQIESLRKDQNLQLLEELVEHPEPIGGAHFIATRVNMDPKAVKDLAFSIKERVKNLFLVIGHEWEGKPGLTVMIAESLVKEKGLHAGNLVRELAKHIQGGGGGQAFFATAGGKDPSGLDKALAESRKVLN
ncbi:MAG: alanine--tRNA ligase-related protein, partial [Bacteroidales bacterium]